MMMIILGIYLVGYVVAYYLTRYVIRVIKGQTDWCWSDVIRLAFVSLLSWGLVVLASVLVIHHILSTSLSGNPPKWL